MSKALIVVDVQRGFMPDNGKPGFGELPVPEGDKIVQPLNDFMTWATKEGFIILSTQDWHPHNTAHFSDKPDFNTTWPRHCVADTFGAFLHPELKTELIGTRFIKGTEALKKAEKDTSYSGYNAFEYGNNRRLPDYLGNYEVDELVIVGLAYDYCVGLTAHDFVQRGYSVTILNDLTRAVNDESAGKMMGELAKLNVKHINSTSYRIIYEQYHQRNQTNT